MKLIPLGGAEEVGATCTLLEIGGHKLLVDAGIRINQPDPLPDLSRITDFGGIEAILVTHAHTDHTGALPVVHRAYPNIPVYATPGTQAIVSVLMSDALNIMKSRYELDREIPLYNKELVDSLFTRMQPVQLGQTIKLFGGDVAATFFPAGHILGAACIGFQSADGESAFISGDISVTPQLTVGGMLPPVSVDKRFRPQLVMVESTYGNRLHANRAAEERRLVETVASVVEAGGRVLIPAFAVGRAQEVLLILANAMARGTIAPFPVWVDGMVRSVCSVYTQHPYDLATALKRQILKRGNPFFGETATVKDVDFTAVMTPDERQKLAESGKPGCIVASSGMLSGGPSSFYARYIAREPDSAIFITGYQDEESPGRALLSLAEATKPEDRVLKLDGETVQVKCRVDKYSLSAHVDAGEVAGLIEQLDPQETVLVHGAGGARESLSDLLMQGKERRLYLPKAGDDITIAGRKSAAKKRTMALQAQAAITEEANKTRPAMPTVAAELMILRDKLFAGLADKQGVVRALARTFTVQEIAQLWLIAAGSGDWAGELTADEYDQFRTLLNQKDSGFVADARRPFLYRLSKAGGNDASKDKKAKESGFPLEQNAALAVVDELFSGAQGLYRRGAILAERKLVLYFHFPEPAALRYQAELADLAARTGWSVELNAETHQAALVDKLGKLLEPTFKLVKVPSIYRELREVRATLAYRGDSDANAALNQLTETYKAETGYNLLATLEGAAVNISPTANLVANDSPNLFVPRGDAIKYEVNTAFAIIDQEIEDVGARVLKKSLKQAPEGQLIELSFVTPEVGAWYRPVIEALVEQIGWPIRINSEPNLQALQETAERVLREIGGNGFMVKKCGFFRDKREVLMKATSISDNPQLDEPAVQARFYELTGWSLKIELEQRQVTVNASLIRDTQVQMLHALRQKRGWDEVTFQKHAGKPIEQLTQAEARRWIAQLTEETKGKPAPR